MYTSSASSKYLQNTFQLLLAWDIYWLHWFYAIHSFHGFLRINMNKVNSCNLYAHCEVFSRKYRFNFLRMLFRYMISWFFLRFSFSSIPRMIWTLEYSLWKFTSPFTFPHFHFVWFVCFKVFGLFVFFRSKLKTETFHYE